MLLFGTWGLGRKGTWRERTNQAADDIAASDYIVVEVSCSSGEFADSRNDIVFVTYYTDNGRGRTENAIKFKLTNFHGLDFEEFIRSETGSYRGCGVRHVSFPATFSETLKDREKIERVAEAVRCQAKPGSFGDNVWFKF